MVIFSKIKNIGILTLASVKFIFNGKANKKIEPRKILIIQTAKLGDMICTSPMFRAVKDKYPGSKLYVMGNAVNGELLNGNPDIDCYIACEKKFSVKDFYRNIKKENFDFACVTAPGFSALAALYFAGIPLISAPVIVNGFSPYETRSYKILRNFVITKSHHMGSYAPREYLRLLEPIGIQTEDIKKYLFYSAEADEKAQKYLSAGGIKIGSDFIAGIAPAAGNKIKQWAPEKFAKIARYLIEKYNAKVVIVADESGREVTGKMLESLIDTRNVINSTGAFNIEELKALVSKLNLFISVDTGPIYIAEAFGIPTVDITGPIDEKEQPPVGKLHRIVKLENRVKPELYVMNARMYDEREAKRQIDEITVEMAIKALDGLMAEISKS